MLQIRRYSTFSYAYCYYLFGRYLSMIGWKKIDDIFHKSTMMLNVIIEKVFYIICLNGPWYYNLVRIYFSNPHRLIKAKFLVPMRFSYSLSHKKKLKKKKKKKNNNNNNGMRCSYFFHQSWLFFQKVIFVSLVEIDDEMICCWHGSYHSAFLRFYF